MTAKPCPICKRPPKLIRRLFRGPFFVCKDSQHTVHSGDAKNVEQAAALWNSIPEIRQLVMER